MLEFLDFRRQLFKIWYIYLLKGDFFIRFLRFWRSDLKFVHSAFKNLSSIWSTFEAHFLKCRPFLTAFWQDENNFRDSIKLPPRVSKKFDRCTCTYIAAALVYIHRWKKIHLCFALEIQYFRAKKYPLENLLRDLRSWMSEF